MSWKDNFVKNWQNVPKSNPKPDLANINAHIKFGENLLIDWLCWGLTTRQPLRVILCRLPEKGRKEIEEIVEEMKEGGREERGTGMKVKKQKK